MNAILKYSGVVALVLLAIIYGGKLFGGSSGLLGSTSCSGITCLSGGLRLVTDAGGDFESDVAALFASTVGVTATTTLSDGLNLDNPGICINFFATSSATRTHFTASTTGTLPAGAAGVITFNYGPCAF